jgi:hypothetical protein
MLCQQTLAISSGLSDIQEVTSGAQSIQAQPVVVVVVAVWEVS